MKPYFENQLDMLASENGTQKSGFAVSDIKHYPTHLYKYRTCDNEYNFEMLEQGYLWADIPQNFIDPNDSLVNLKLKSELPAIEKWLYSHLGELLYYSISPKGMKKQKHGQTLQSYKIAQESFFDSLGRYSAKRAKSLMLLETKKLRADQRQQMQKIYDSFESLSLSTKWKMLLEPRF